MNSAAIGCAFRRTGCVVKDVANRSTGAVGRYTFSTSSTRRRHGAVPKFTECSSPELESLLDSIRQKIIMPAHLPKAKLDLVYKGKNKNQLVGDQAIVVIGGEEFTLQHLDKTKIDHKSMWKALHLMKERKDWDNLVPLLQGLAHAKLWNYNPSKQHPKTKTRLLNILGRRGRQDVLLECLRRATETKMSLYSTAFTEHVFHWMSRKAIENDWDAEATSKALHWTEIVYGMLDLPHHDLDAKKSYKVVGVLLELAAVRASKHLGGEDKEGKVKQYAEMLVECMTPRNEQNAFIPPQEEFAIVDWITTHAPLLYGMEKAEEILDLKSETAKQFTHIVAELKTVVENLVAERTKIGMERGNPEKGVGLGMYNKLFLQGD